MLKEGLLIKTAGSRYSLPRRLDCLTGVVQGNRRDLLFCARTIKEKISISVHGILRMPCMATG